MFIHVLYSFVICVTTGVVLHTVIGRTNSAAIQYVLQSCPKSIVTFSTTKLERSTRPSQRQTLQHAIKSAYVLPKNRRVSETRKAIFSQDDSQTLIINNCLRCGNTCGKNNCETECRILCAIHFSYDNRKEYESEFKEFMRRINHEALRYVNK